MSTALVSLLLAGVARADDEFKGEGEEPLPAYAPLRAVGVILETGQAFLWDDKTSEYRLAKVGEELYGWKIVALEPERVLIAQAGIQDELPLEPAPRKVVGLADKCKAPELAQAQTQPQQSPPVAQPAPTAPRQLPSVVVDREPEQPKSATDASPVVPAPDATPPVVEERYTVARVELERELTDFGRVMSTVQVKTAPGGGFVITHLQPTAWLSKIGFHEGDVVRSIAGERVSTVDDAARVYARLRAIHTFVVEIDRGTRRVILHYQIVT